MRKYHSQIDFKKYRHKSIKKSNGGFFTFLKKRKSRKNKIDALSRDTDRPLSNPWKQKPKKNWKNTILLITSLIFILGWVALMFYLPFFKITTINITNTQITNADEVREYIKGSWLYKNKIIPSDNYFLLRRRSMEQGIVERFGLQDTSIKKIFPHEIEVVIQEKICSVIYYDGRSYYLIDKFGKIITPILNDIKTAPNTTTPEVGEANSNTSTPIITFSTEKPDVDLIRKEFNNQPIIFDEAATGKNENGELLSSNLIENIIDWHLGFETENLGQIKYFYIENPTAGIKVFTDQNWYVLFDHKADLTTQLNNLKTILAQAEPQEYIDLRFGEKIYWK